MMLRCPWIMGLTVLFVSGSAVFGQGWEVHTPPSIEGGIKCTDSTSSPIPGFTILLQKGESVKMSAKVIDVDRKLKASSTEYEYKNDDGEVVWTKTGGGTLTPARTASGAVTTYTAPDTVGTYQITATPEDKPTLADDAAGSGYSITIKVIDSCPDSISIGSSCSPIPEWTYWKSFGYLMTQMCVSGGTPPSPPGNWNGLMVREVVVPKSNSCGAGDFNINPDSNGTSTWTVGSGGTGWYTNNCSQKCYAGNADNCLWDHHSSTYKDTVALVAGHGPCVVKASQTYFCKDKPIGGFIITRTYTLDAGHCAIGITKE